MKCIIALVTIIVVATFLVGCHSYMDLYKDAEFVKVGWIDENTYRYFVVGYEPHDSVIPPVDWQARAKDVAMSNAYFEVVRQMGHAHMNSLGLLDEASIKLALDFAGDVANKKLFMLSLIEAQYEEGEWMCEVFVEAKKPSLRAEMDARMRAYFSARSEEYKTRIAGGNKKVGNIRK